MRIIKEKINGNRKTAEAIITDVDRYGYVAVSMDVGEDTTAYITNKLTELWVEIDREPYTLPDGSIENKIFKEVTYDEALRLCVGDPMDALVMQLWDEVNGTKTFKDFLKSIHDDL